MIYLNLFEIVKRETNAEISHLLAHSPDTRQQQDKARLKPEAPSRSPCTSLLPPGLCMMGRWIRSRAEAKASFLTWDMGISRDSCYVTKLAQHSLSEKMPNQCSSEHFINTFPF